jgi:formylglycine-generating enzyme required for sulfatase activity
MRATVFDLSIRSADDAYTLHATAPDSVGDLATQPFTLPFRLAELPQQRKNAADWVKQARIALRRGSEEQRLAREFGAALFARLFSGETLAGYRAARARLGPDERLLLRLRLPPELTPLPWELTYDPQEESFLALDPRVTLVRHPELTRPLAPLRVDGPLEVVVVLANPRSDIYAPLNLDRELARIRSALRELERDGRLRLSVISGPGTLRQLRARLRQPVHVLHIISHGDLDHGFGEGVLIFEDADGAEEQVNAELLRQYLQIQRGQTRLVLLNACLGALPPADDPFGSMGAALLRADVPAVIAMQFELPDVAAADLSEVFYDELAAGQPVDLALSRARLHLYGKFRQTLDWAIPVLYLRASDGLLFAPQPEVKPTASTSEPAAPTPLTEPSPQAGHNVNVSGGQVGQIIQGDVGGDLTIGGTLPARTPSAEDNEERRKLEELLAVAKAHAHELEIQRATMGIHTPPHVITELKRFTDEIVRLEAQLAAYERPQRSTAPPPKPDPTRLARLWQQALSAYVTRRWEDAERLLDEVAALDPNYRDVQARLQRAREQRALQAFYADIAALRAGDDWQGVLGALDELAQRAPEFGDPAGHRAWAEGRQRREERYAAALNGCDQRDWITALNVLGELLRELPDDAEAKALEAFVRGELETQQQREEADRQRREAAQRRRAQEEAERKQRERFGQIDVDLQAHRFETALNALEKLLTQQPADRAAVERVAACIENKAVPLAQRLRAGELAGKVGDPRSGVVVLPPAMVRFSGGWFVIGSTADEAEQAGIAYEAYWLKRGEKDYAKTLRTWPKDHEVNSQSLTLPAFELARYPVTNAQYALFIADGGYHPDKPWWDEAGRAWLQRDDAKTKDLQDWQKRTRKDQPGYWDDERFGKAHPNYPVVGVNWYEASAFCRWLSQHKGYNPEGHRYLLPSEAEWEFAARGTKRRAYAWGNDEPDAERANFNQTHSGTTPVGCFPAGATPEGLLEMTGNVWEWTRSEFKPYPYNPGDGRERGDDPAQKFFTPRGGSWSDPPIDLRAADRYLNTPGFHRVDVGFRLARHLSS